MRKLVAAIGIAAVLLLTGCSGGEQIKASSGDPDKAVVEEEAAPDVQVEVVSTYFTDDPFARFVVKFTNPADKTRVGVEATWKALDKDGVIVATYDTRVPPISPGGTWYYVAGAGSAFMSGTPTKADIEVTDKGELKGEAFTSLVAADKPKFEKSQFNMFKVGKSYDVETVITATDDVETEKISSAAILLDKNGKVVGGDWLDFSSAPTTLAVGEKVKATANVLVAKGKPTEVQIFVWAD